MSETQQSQENTEEIEVCIECQKLVKCMSKVYCNICPICYDLLIEQEREWRDQIPFQPATLIVDPSHDTQYNKNTPIIYLGPENSAYNLEYLHQQKIDRVLIVGNCMFPKFEKEGIIYDKIEIEDMPEMNIKQFFNQAFEFIQGTKSAVLIHCASGISRSATITIAWLMKNNKTRFEQTRDFV